MKTTITILCVLSFLFTGCNKTELADIIDDPENKEKDPELLKELTDGFCLALRDTVVLNHLDFDYYDYSAHMVYMKDHMSFEKDIQGNGGDFKVYANKEVIYSGQTYPAFLSSLPRFPVVIQTWPSLYADYLIPIEYYDSFPLADSLGNVLPDPRNDERIVNALKKYNQFRAGLSGEIKSVIYSSPNDVTVELLLQNNDSINYWYLDPNKMGIMVFNYITNGLYLRELNSNKYYTHKMGSTSPGSGVTWKDWVSLIRFNEGKVVTIHYESFDVVPLGKYKATFMYPGLWKVEKKDLNYGEGWVWMGKLHMKKEITID
jgi:hypothetical protein